MKQTVLTNYLRNGMYKSAMAMLFIVLLLDEGCSHQPSYPPAPHYGANIAIDETSIETNIPKFFTHHFHGKSISYFVFKSEGKVLSFFDACANCYPHKMGYRYQDQHVSCRNCSQEFPINKLEKGLGTCFPIKIEGRVESGKYLIPIATLEAAADKF